MRGFSSTAKKGTAPASSAAMGRMTASSAGSIQYTPVWYWLPKSGPWRLGVSGSMTAKKAKSRWGRETAVSSYSTRTASRKPVRPVQTSS